MKITSAKRKMFAVGMACITLISCSTVLAQTAPQESTSSLSRDQLTLQIQEKANQLQTISTQLQSTQANLQNAKGQRASLQNELNNLTGNISQLNLNLKSDEINIQKLGLEIDSLNYDLADIKQSIEDKKASVEKLLLELQKNDHQDGNLLTIFLSSASLADGVLEAQTLKNLQGQLTEDVGSLKSAEDEYNQKIQLANNKKGSVASHEQNLENRKLIVQDQQQERATLLIQTKNKESVFAQQVADLEKQQKQITDEMEALDSVLRTKIDPSMLPTVRSGVLMWPIDGGKNVVTQGYGKTTFARATYNSQWHNGIDIGIPIGTPVVAADDGLVVATGNQDLYCPRAAYGKFIVIKHGDNLVTLYGHMSQQIVKPGDHVLRGQTIGYSGKTGWATGAHLHFTVFAGSTFYMRPTVSCGPMPQGGDLNPLGYL